MNDLQQRSKADIQKGSKSFAMASFFFNAPQRTAAWQLYAWCRYCDDQIDGSIGGGSVEELRRLTEDAYRGTPSAHHPWPAFADVVRRYKIPQTYALDLLRGFAMDAKGFQPSAEAELLEYAYCVAGAVGLMMCHIMGVNSQDALQPAVALGQAMQLTNIARDVREDAEKGRSYLPKTWLRDAGLSDSELPDVNDPRVYPVVLQLLERADRLYEQGRVGLRHLPLRSGWAVAIALYVYRSIGIQIRRSGLQALQRRAVVGPLKKTVCLVRASFTILTLVPGRILRPWRRQGALELWRNL